MCRTDASSPGKLEPRYSDKLLYKRTNAPASASPAKTASPKIAQRNTGFSVVSKAKSPAKPAIVNLRSMLRSGQYATTTAIKDKKGA